jgi:hypothetical protein
VRAKPVPVVPASTRQPVFDGKVALITHCREVALAMGYFIEGSIRGGLMGERLSVAGH